jgi:hypothetical protein
MTAGWRARLDEPPAWRRATLVGRPPYSSQWRSVVFYTLPDGGQYLHDGTRATPKVA